MSQSDELSLAEGGPLWRFERRLGLVHPGGVELPRVITWTLLAWLPQLILAVIEPIRRSQVLRLWFGDFANHARLLLAIPVLLIADVLIEARVRRASQRLRTQIIQPRALGRFTTLQARLGSLARSGVVELLIAALAYFFALLIFMWVT